MRKIIAIIEVFYLAILWVVGGLWQVIFNNKRVDYQLLVKPLYKRKPKKKIPTDKEIFLDFMARNT